MSKARTGTADVASPPELDEGAAQLLALVRRRGPLTRTEMTTTTGWARVTVTSRLEKLLATGLLVADDAVPSGRGRPATRYRLDASCAMLLVADVGALGMRLARVDLEGRIEEASSVGVDIAVGPGRAARPGAQVLRRADRVLCRAAALGGRHQPARARRPRGRPGDLAARS